MNIHAMKWRSTRRLLRWERPFAELVASLDSDQWGDVDSIAANRDWLPLVDDIARSSLQQRHYSVAQTWNASTVTLGQGANRIASSMYHGAGSRERSSLLKGMQ
jgi:hypothetical protein